MKVVLFRVAIVASVLLTCALLAEGLLRILGVVETPLVSWQTEALHRPDPELVYSLSPGASSEWHAGEFVERVHVNSQGLRGEEIPVRQPGESRILVLGDSMTFGHGVDDEETYSAQLQLLLRGDGSDVHVINAGVRGYGTDHAYRFFVSRLRDLHPDLVVFAFYENDVSDDIERPLYAVEGGRLVALPATAQRLYRIGRIYECLPGVARGSRLVNILVPLLAGLGAAPEAPVRRPPALIATVRDRSRLQLEDLEAISKQDGFSLILLGIPYSERDPERDAYLWLHAAPLAGIDWLDLSAEPQWKLEAEQLFFPRDGHLTVLGHRRVAERLHRFIRAGELLPPPPS